MTYYIGGSKSGQQVAFEDMHNSEICDFGEKLRAFDQQRKYYRKLQISFHGTVKTFFVIDGKKPIDCRDQIIDLWDQVKTDVYAI
ncbi:hypothetical protein DIW83_05820 [Acinetobacter nosocomialis]|uniref:hypothetical protein n=1 Tax=Acinetobacter nosocomialis TaxID=106654 RepID=UPI0002F2D9BE|nr:hypothetical protein [Acinetobacter nosocomialis]AWL18579.1 hypothetical protein DIW83_05820 [Acinetobacter nosocomialis]